MLPSFVQNTFSVLFSIVLRDIDLKFGIRILISYRSNSTFVLFDNCFCSKVVFRTFLWRHLRCWYQFSILLCLCQTGWNWFVLMFGLSEIISLCSATQKKFLQKKKIGQGYRFARGATLCVSFADMWNRAIWFITKPQKLSLHNIQKHW